MNEKIEEMERLDRQTKIIREIQKKLREGKSIGKAYSIPEQYCGYRVKAVWDIERAFCKKRLDIQAKLYSRTMTRYEFESELEYAIKHPCCLSVADEELAKSLLEESKRTSYIGDSEKIPKIKKENLDRKIMTYQLKMQTLQK